MTIKSFLFMKFFVSFLLLSTLFLNGCKKGTSDVNPSLSDVCLISKKTTFDAQGKIKYEQTYSYNNKRQVSSIKYYANDSNGPSSDTESLEYNSDGQVIKKTSSKEITTYTYENKFLVEENRNLGTRIYSTKYFYDKSRISKISYKITEDNKISANEEQAYFYKDTLLIRIMYRNIIANSPVQGYDYAYKYDAQNRLIETQTLRQNNAVENIKKYEYGTDRNAIKMTQFTANNFKEYEETFTYVNNKLVEQTIYSFYSNVLPPLISKKVFEYKHDNITKMTYSYEGELYIYEQYTYTCDK